MSVLEMYFPASGALELDFGLGSLLDHGLPAAVVNSQAGLI